MSTATCSTSDEPIQRPSTRGNVRFKAWILSFVFLLSALYMGKMLLRSWAPEDEGTLAQPAERVLHGELPQRDFDDPYTGGEAFLNAFAFRLFGIRLVSMRYMLFIFFLAWVPAVFYIASKFSSSLVAGAVTLLAVVWSVPNYPAAMPSWYNLFVATLVIAVLLREIERPSRILFAVAGACAGASFLCKQSGIFLIGGVLLYLLFRSEVMGTGRRAVRVSLGAVVVMFGAAGYLCSLILLIAKSFSVVSALCFLTPALAVGMVPLWDSLAKIRRDIDLDSLFKDLLCFAGGLTLVLLIFAYPYIVSGSVDQLVRGVFVAPEKRFAYAILSGSSAKVLAGGFIDTLLLLLVLRGHGRLPRWSQALTAVAFGVAIVFSRYSSTVLKITWAAIWMSLPLVLVVGAVYLMRGAQLPLAAASRQKLFLILAVTANCGLIQFPYTTAEYFLFVAPLAALTTLAVFSLWVNPPRVWLAGLLAFCFVFMAADCTPGWVWKMGVEYASNEQSAYITVPRAQGLRVDPTSARMYEELGRVIAQHAQGPYILVTPDAPEVYFLYGFRNPTRTLWDFFDNPVGRTARILATVDEHHVNLVVIRNNPFSSGPVPPDLMSGLLQRYPNSVGVGRFEVRWR
jgi:hypothetical protein